ncbi:MAG: hypothetical protein WBB67_03005 [bacterium]
MKYIIYSIFLLVFCLTLSSADAPIGISGFVYDNIGEKAGDALVDIYIINVVTHGTASYYYSSETSFYLTNDEYGLSDGTWRLQGEIEKDGTTYWSQWYRVSWEYPQSVQQDIHCTDISRPAWPEDK